MFAGCGEQAEWGSWQGKRGIGCSVAGCASERERAHARFRETQEEGTGGICLAWCAGRERGWGACHPAGAVLCPGGAVVDKLVLVGVEALQWEPLDFTPMAVNSISFGPPHVRPMWALSTCGEPNEIKKKTPPKCITALFREQTSRSVASVLVMLTIRSWCSVALKRLFCSVMSSTTLNRHPLEHTPVPSTVSDTRRKALRCCG